MQPLHFLKRIPGTGRQKGQVMVLFALLLPVFIGILGLGIDSAHIFNARRDMQSAADLAALAGASQLPGDPGAAQSIAAGIAADNGFSGGNVSVTAPFNGDDGQIEVVVSEEVGLFFMPALGIPNVTITARSVASHEINAGTAVMAKKDYHCWNGTVTWSGSNITVDGSVHSNGGLTLSGNGNTVTGDFSYKIGAPTYPWDGQQSCEPDVRVTGSNPNIELVQKGWQDWPVLYSRSDFPCTYNLGTSNGNLERDGAWWVGGRMLPDKKLRPGVICFNGDADLYMEENGVSGNVTFRAKHIDIGGTNTTFTAHTNGVLFFSDADRFPSMRLDPVGGRWEGMIYNRYPSTSTIEGGQIVITGSSGFQHVGTIVGWAVTLAGSNWSLFGTENATFEPMRLVE